VAIAKTMVRRNAPDRAERFHLVLKAKRLPRPVPEFRFHPVRKFRFDYAWPEFRLALEVEGGVWTGGKHGRGSGIVKDMEKSTIAAEEGWRIIRVTPSKLATIGTAESVERALRWRAIETGPNDY